MASTTNVREWLGQWAGGDEHSAKLLFDQFFAEVVDLARAHLRGSRRRTADEEDVALSAMNSLLQGTSEGRWPQCDDHDGLWRLLATITIRKAAAQVRRESRLRRGGGNVRGDSVFQMSRVEQPVTFQNAQASADSSPELAAMMAERCRDLLDRLGDPTLRTIAQYRLQGYTNREIATAIGKVEETVRRKVGRIREIWSQEVCSHD